MYTSFFGLNEKPFSITPDPRYLFMSERHTEALAHLIYGVKESGGFIQLTGEVGTGKTTLVRSLLQQLPDSADVALVLNPQLSRTEFLSAICEELGVALPASADSIKSLTNVLNAYLLRNHSQGRRTILIVDEAQNLRVDVLEQVRLLTNLETTKQKLLQIILIGQEELRELLSRNDMRQLAQRITGRYHLEPLTRSEAIAYIDHRVKVAGGTTPLFTYAAKRELYRLSSGVPRSINVIADRALLGAFTQEARQVTPTLVRNAASEVYDRRAITLSAWYRWIGPAAAGAAAMTVALILGWTGTEWLISTTRAPQATDSAASVSRSVADIEPEAARIPATEPTMQAILEPVPPLDSAPDKLIDILRQEGEYTTTDVAFKSLFTRWGAEYIRGPIRACKQAEGFNLYCLFQRGSLSQVRSLDRPVILTLRDELSNEHQVMLSGLSDSVAVISIGENNYQVATMELTDFWFGDYLLLWRPEIGEVKSFFPGMRDQGVKWLRESLAEIQGEPVSPMESDFYDEILEARVRDYQRERRLNVDGLVGQQTQIAINTDRKVDNGPRLTRVN
jgi:general secretion pathway protein A